MLSSHLKPRTARYFIVDLEISAYEQFLSASLIAVVVVIVVVVNRVVIAIVLP